MTKKKKCPICGKDFTRKTEARNQKYCCKACASEAKRIYHTKKLKYSRVLDMETWQWRIIDAGKKHD